MEIRQFDRMRSAAGTGEGTREVGIVLRQTSNKSLVDALRPKSRRGLTIPISGATGSGTGTNNTASHIANLEHENKRLRASLERAVQVNEKMWAGAVQMKLVQPVPGT